MKKKIKNQKAYSISKYFFHNEKKT